MPHSSSNAATPPARPHNRPRNVPTSLNIINVFAAVQMFLINYDFKYFTAFFISYCNSISYLLVAHSWSLIKIIKVKLCSFHFLLSIDWCFVGFSSSLLLFIFLCCFFPFSAPFSCLWVAPEMICNISSSTIAQVALRLGLNFVLSPADRMGGNI